MTYRSRAFQPLLVTLMLLPACGGGSGGGQTTPDGATGQGTGGSVVDAGGDVFGGGGTGGNGGTATGGTGAPGTGGTGQTTQMSTGTLPATGGDHFCMTRQKDAATAFYFGFDDLCFVTVADTPLTEQQRTLLDQSCVSIKKGTVVGDCPRGNAVAYCELTTITPIKGKTYTIVNKSPVNNDADAVATNAVAICGGGATPYDMNGVRLQRKCKGTVTAKVDGQIVDFSEQLSCLYKNDGTRTQFTLQASKSPNRPEIKTLNLTVHRINGVYKIGDAILNTTPAYGYSEGGNVAGVFPFPKDPTMATVSVSKLDANGAGFTATFSMGELWSKPNFTGNLRTVTEGTLDLQIYTP